MKKKIRGLLISQFFWPENFPINKVLKSIKKIQFSIITAKPNYPGGRIFTKYRKRGILTENYYSHKIYHLPVFPRRSGTSFFLLLNYFSFLFSSIFYGTRYLKRKKIDFVFVYNTSPITQILVGYYFKVFFGVKLASWVQDIWPESVSATNHARENLLFKIFRQICHYIYRLNDVLILQSIYFEKYFRKYKIYVKNIYIPNTANISKKITKNSFILKKKI